MAEINNFIKTIMQNDLDSGKVDEIITRFPPEPNAYLHIGHARAIITNFELAKAFNGKTNLRFDDTNPAKEDKEFVEGIIEDLAWLGYKPANIFYGSDYFEATYLKAIDLIKRGLAYVDDLSQEEISKYRGTLNEPGKNSPYRDRSVEENLKLFEEMKEGKYADGEKTLRAKIDMASPNINMRDPVMYRILHINHHRQGTKWCIFPMYDFAHPLQDSFEGITHSLCSLEYDNHRVLYDWVVDNCGIEKKPHQYEFGRLNITNTIMSKRYLRALVDAGKVSGYDDPRMPTLCGLRRRGFTPDSIRNFILGTGLSRVNSTVEAEQLDEELRSDLRLKAIRPNAVINPVKVIIDNYPEGKVEWLDAPNNQENEELGSRKISFSREVYIEREDFIEEKPNKKWKRLSLGVEVRLMKAYFITANSVEKDENGNITVIHATYDPETKSGEFDGRKPNGNIHYVDASNAIPAEFRLFEPLMLDETEENKDLDFMERLNPDSIHVFEGFVEKSLEDTKPLDHYQFIRNGYYCTDKDSTKDKLVFNRTCGLKSSFKL
ncbi:MAG: glutamine--tRNA ligase/YqeY domain fusion protein [Anaeroplasma sp.]|uniref:glutamine--tRNA ligase/YqeY domain fusion protein n=1 Tax=Anaeroplasma sp. TaxID=1872523 RepID=UPI002A91FEF4|nr:glutamine--tRNA ligase/YqeY domain fusion protein [Anaeroplasma sp.]MDY5983080.1 glutamine--tRNA ligase/YqeY domain fusion protein [Anaeroplasma sp.]